MGGTWRRIGVVALAAATGGVAAAAPATAETPRKVMVNVSEECTAPAAIGTNSCGIRGVLGESTVDGFDIHWEVTLFFNDQWRIQFQAFSETATTECQHQMRVWGSYRAPGFDAVSFVTSSGLDLGITPGEHPNVTMRVDRVRIDTQRSTCA